MPGPNVTYTFSNGTTADAGQVNTNFNDLINGATDGSKDYTINAMTINDTLSVSGAVTLGNGSGDAITINGSLASDFLISANNTYDIGSATLGLDTLFLGNNTRTVGLKAGVITTSYVITFPVAAAAITVKTLIFNTTAVSEFRYPDKFVAAQTTAYTATGDETVIPCTPAASFDLTLPDVAVATGKVYEIYKTDTDVTKIITIKTSAAVTVTTINTQGEVVCIKSNGTSWTVIFRYIPSVWLSYSPTLTGMGTVSGKEFLWRRIGENAEVKGACIVGTRSAATGTITLPGGLSLDTTKVLSEKRETLGYWYGGITTTGNATPATTRGPWYISNRASDATTVFLGQDVDLDQDATGTFFAEQNFSAMSGANNTGTSFRFTVPISGWNG